MRIENQDCLEFLAGIEDGSVDLIITDPPYDMAPSGGGGFGKKREYLQEIWAEGSELRRPVNLEVLKEFDRIQKVKNLYIFCNVKMLPDLFDYYKNDKFDLLIYHKKNPIPLTNGGYLRDLEYIFYVCNDRANLLGGGYHEKSKLFSINIPKREYDHPTIKPLEIVKTLVSNSSKKGDLVLDCYLGSGTTAMACKILERDFIGCEINPKHFDTIQKRLNAPYTGDLFN